MRDKLARRSISHEIVNIIGLRRQHMDKVPHWLEQA